MARCTVPSTVRPTRHEHSTPRKMASAPVVHRRDGALACVGMLDEFERIGVTFHVTIWTFMLCAIFFAFTSATRTLMGAMLLTLLIGFLTFVMGMRSQVASDRACARCRAAGGSHPPQHPGTGTLASTSV